MINIYNITKALQDQLNADSDVASFLRHEVLMDEYVNTNPSHAPWACVYKGETNLEPRTLGAGVGNFTARPSPRVVVQAVSYKSGEDCSLLLDDYVDKVLTAVLSDYTLGSTVLMIIGFNIEYGYVETEKPSIHFQTARITINCEVKTS